MSRIVRAGLLALLATLTFGLAQAGIAGGYYGLLIANSAYADAGWAKLKTPARDVAELDRILTGQYGFQTKILRDATRTQIIDEIESFRGRLGEDDSLLIYFAGHGILREGDGGYWVGADGTTSSRSGWLKYDVIDDLIDFRTGMKARHVLVVADSCYSGAALRSRGEFGDQQGVARDELLRRRAQLRSRTVLTSGGTEPVLDSVGTSEHSVFATEFLEKLRSNTAILDGHALFSKIEPEVFGRAQRVLGALAQAPEYGALKGIGHDGGDFLFVPAGMSLPAPGPTAPAPSNPFEVRGPTTVVHQNMAGTVHLGDEKIRNWAPVSGQCYEMPFQYGGRIDELTLRYDVYGAENTVVELNGRSHPFEAMIPEVGKKRPNYWSNGREFRTLGINLTGAINLRICSQVVKNPEFPGDLDDFQLRNIIVQVN